MRGVTKRTVPKHSSCIAAGLPLLVVLFLGSRAAAYDLSVGDLELFFDSTFSFGLQVRTEGVDKKNYCTTIGGPNALEPGENVPDGAGAGPGENGDCGKSAGNLNYDKGKLSSTILKGLHELDVRYKNYSSLVRFQWWYDGINENGERARTDLTDKAKGEAGAGVQLLDAFIQGNWYPADIPVTLKFGNQVVNWGESTFLQNGLSVINPFDVRKLRVPGAELREAVLPVPIVWASVSPSEYLSLEGFYQFWWEKTKVDPPGTYFSTHDAVGPGGKWFDISQGHHDCDITPFAGSPIPNALLGLRHDGTVGATCIRRGGNVTPSNQGQYGFAAHVFVPLLNGADFGLYYMNVHNRLPIISGSFQETVGQAGARLFGAAFDPTNPALVGASINEVLVGTQANQAYPENVKKVGASFSSTIEAIALAIQGEFSYTFDQPLQLSEVQLLRGLFASAGIPGVAPAPGVPSVAPGEFFSGAVEKDVLTAQMTFTYVGEPGRVVGGWLKASQFIFVSEIGYLNVRNFDSTAHLPLQGSVTPQNELTGSSATQRTRFGTRDSAGYVVRMALPYNNLFSGVNLTPFVGWRHDFSGVTPAPLGNYIKGRKAVNAGVRFDFDNSWSSTVSYTNFFGGGVDNPINDRDFFSFDVKYSF